MSRCRLRFLLHEIDLALGATIIGRGIDCHVALDDPLVSRRHARIVVGTDRAVVQDLGSRNGVYVNGTPIQTLTPLADGDRLRVGSQELVFCEGALDSQPPVQRATGELRFCASCSQPYPREVVSCPGCEETEQIDEDTLTGARVPAASSLLLLVESLDRALGIGRVEEAHRVAGRMVEQVAQHLAAFGTLDGALLGAMAAQIARLTAASDDASLAFWVLDVYRATGHVPPSDIAKRLTEAAQAAAEQPPSTGVLT
ncbi:MAG TPA: FHA domain-containing protein [Polyangiaceae bacterium]|nr:FHA domain-containing protein [Polyangiaceae bacterium]